MDREIIEYNGVEYEVFQDSYSDDPREMWDDVSLKAIRGGYDSVEGPDAGEITDYFFSVYKENVMPVNYGGTYDEFLDYDDEDEIKESLGFSGEDWDTEAGAEEKAIFALWLELVNGVGDSPEEALDFTKRACELMGIGQGNKAEIHNIVGYSQSDWLDVIVEGPSSADLSLYAKEFEMWARGDVWRVEDLETGEGISGIYASDPEEAVKHFAEIY